MDPHSSILYHMRWIAIYRCCWRHIPKVRWPLRLDTARIGFIRCCCFTQCDTMAFYNPFQAEFSHSLCGKRRNLDPSNSLTVHVCTSGKSCIAKLSELNRTSIEKFIPTLVLIDIPYEDQLPEHKHARTPSPGTKLQIDGVQESATEDAYGLKLLQWVASDIQYHALSPLFVPVAVVSPKTSSSEPSSTPAAANSQRMSPVRTSSRFIMNCNVSRRVVHSGLVVTLQKFF
jgi:hypothetical protein